MDPSSSHQHRPTLQLDTSPQRQQQGQQQGQQGELYSQPTEQPFHIPDLSSQLAHSALSSSSPSQPPTLAAPSSHLPPRSFSPARRAQSMKEQPSTSLLLPSALSSSTASNSSSASNPPISGLASVGSSSVVAPGGGNEGSVLAGVLSGMEGAQDGGSAATTLARRNNTVSTASSRLVRLERTRARLALQGAGLSEEDQNFYVPPSPARGGPYALNAPWSDIGHGASSSTASLPLSGGGMAAFEGEQAWRRAEQMQQQQQQSVAAATTTTQQQPQQQNEPKRSSFVVLRGGKGDSALTERRSHQPTSSISSTISPPPIIPQSTDSPSPIIAGDQPLRHKNSLKPFLEQERAESGGGGEGGEVVEDWERGLMDERRSAAEGGLLNGGAIGEEGDDWRNTDPYATLTTPPLSSSFPSQLSSPFSSTHARANTVATHQTRRNNTTDPWLPPSAAPGLTGASVLSTEEDPNLIRRHQSLTSFRQREPSIEQTMGVLSSSPGQSSWADHSGPIDEHSLHHHHQQPLGRTASGGRTAYGSLALGAAPSISGFGSRMRSGTSPAPLTLHHSASLGHNAAPRTPHAATAGLAHSNSLSSHPYPQGATGLSHSDSLGSRSDGGAGEAARRVISPVMNAFPGTRSPWSPTEEETKQLSLAASSSSSAAVGGTGGGSGGSLSRGGSGSSRGSHATGSHEGAVPAYASLAGGLNGRFADEVRRLDEGMGGMQLGPPGTPSSSSRAPSTSPQPPPTANNNAARRLPPLMTGADVLLGGGGVAAGGLAGMGMAGRAGPASAAAFVPPIGHSHFFGGAGGLDGISENGGTFPPPPQQQQQQNGFGGPLLPSAFSQQQLPPTSFPPVPPPFPDPTSSAAAAPLPPAASSLGPLRGNFTAHPGAPSSLDWARQKEFLLGAAAGATPTSSAYVNGAPSSAATVVPGPFANTPGQPGADWPSQQQQQQQQQQAAAGGGGPQNVDLATLQQQLQLQHVQQQQQINMLQSQMAKALSAMDAMRAQGAVVPPSFEAGLRAAVAGAGVGAAGEGATGVGGASGANGAAVAETPIDVNGLVAKKGYNPAVFDLRPKNARFFVIKSYTEEDVHKSLKYEIWASTDLGNKRLDRAFRESADKGPIYLFFSVNASGHFAGMAQMLTPVDYSMSSNVWASDKWKGVLKVRWIYIKDVPLSALRHIRLSNTPENKPVTSSRDTQEVPYDAGLEVLRIIASYQSRTSLLQDYAWYEASSRLQHQHQAQAAAAQAQGGDASLALLPPQQGDVPLYQPGHHYQNHQQNQHNQHNNHGNQHAGASGHSTPSPQPPSLAPHQQQGHIPPIPPSPHQPQTQPSPKQAPRNAQAGGRRFWNRSGGGGGGGAEVPPVPPVPQQQQQGYYQAPPHLQQQMQMQGQGQYPPQQVGNGMAY